MESIRKPWFGAFFVAGLLVIFVAACLRVPSAQAVPSFSRQTGFPCSSCHYTPPELTPLGRTFKLNGYTLVGEKTISSKKTDHQSGLDLLEAFPLSVLFDTSFSSTKVSQSACDIQRPRGGAAGTPFEHRAGKRRISLW